MASVLETQLKTIIRTHPDVQVHPYSPTGPYVRAVMWTADPELLGQAFWEPDDQQWVVRAVHGPTGETSLVVDHPPTMDTITASISAVIADLRSRHTTTEGS